MLSNGRLILSYSVIPVETGIHPSLADRLRGNDKRLDSGQSCVTEHFRAIKGILL